MWHVYLVLCSDSSLYCGVATDVARRVAEHNGSKRGARYTRSRRPVELAYCEEAASRSAACKREAEIKRMARRIKQGLVVLGGLKALVRRFLDEMPGSPTFAERMWNEFCDMTTDFERHRCRELSAFVHRLESILCDATSRPVRFSHSTVRKLLEDLLRER